MKNEKLLKLLLTLFIICFIAGVLWYKYENRRVYTLNIPDSYELNSIVVESKKGNFTTSDEKEMEDILTDIAELNLKTKIESSQDMPTGVANFIAIRLYYREDKVKNFYLYEKKNKYYLEEPYNGIYKLKENDYNFLLNLVK